MNYIGSKFRLLEFLESSIKRVVGDDYCTFCDLFAGTGTVGAHFKKLGHNVISNDAQYYSYVLNNHLLCNNKKNSFKGLWSEIPELEFVKAKNREKVVCDYLNNLPLVEGFIYKNYTSGGTINSENVRTYFTDENGKICDTIRIKIESWKTLKKITKNEYFFLLSCLIEATDKRANTASVYGAFLKEFKKVSLERIEMVPLETIVSKTKNKVYNSDINLLIRNLNCDIIYLDPPYNTRVYSDYYHLLETIAKYDNPEITGKTGNRKERILSDYSSKSKVKKAFEDLIKNCRAKYIFLSYNNEGLLSLDDIKDIMSKKGEYGYFVKDYQRFKSDKTENRNHKDIDTFEYLHYVIC